MNRDELILEWWPTARKMAERKWHNLGGVVRILGIDLDDLAQSGVVGLIEAVDKQLAGARVNLGLAIGWAIDKFLQTFEYFHKKGRGHGVAVQKVRLSTNMPLRAKCKEFVEVERRLDAWRMLGLLPKQERGVVRLLLGGLSQAEIGRRLGRTRAAVGLVVGAAIRRLRGCQWT